MDLIKFEQLIYGHVYVLQSYTSNRVLLFEYLGGTLNGDCIIPSMIEFSAGVLSAPTAYYIGRSSKGSDFNASSNILFSGYRDMTGTSLGVYRKQATADTYKDLWKISIYSDIHPNCIQTFKFLP